MGTDKEPTDAEIAAEAAAIYRDTNDGPPSPQQIAQEAHAIYLARGGEHGHDVDDWLEAERRLQTRLRSGSATWQERDADRRGHGDDDLKA
jgi:hypothetical protein